METNKIKAKGSKMLYGRKVEYAGMRLSEEGSLPDIKIIYNILNYGKPKNIS